MRAEGPNEEQIRYWDEISGPKWAQLGDEIDALIHPIGSRALARAAAARGEHVLDVGCGCGHTSLELSRAVGDEGRVLGVDVSGPMLAVARERGREAPSLRFAHADAQTHDFDTESFDLVFSRFGVMFFADPVAAFANLRRALREGGRLVFACWQAPDKNPWMIAPAAAAAAHVPSQPMPGPDAPGPYSLADPDRIREVVEGAGFESVTLHDVSLEIDLVGARPLEDALDFVMQMGPTGRMLQDADDALKAKVRESLEELFAAHERPGGTFFDAAAWVVRARA